MKVLLDLCRSVRHTLFELPVVDGISARAATVELLVGELEDCVEGTHELC